MTTHLIPTVEEFAEYAQALADEVGGVPLHPDNRRTACGKRMNRQTMSVTEDPARVTCKACAKRAVS